MNGGNIRIITPLNKLIKYLDYTWPNNEIKFDSIKTFIHANLLMNLAL